MASTSSSLPAPAPVRSWRTAFLTLRDETLTTPLRTPIPDLLHNLIFSNSTILISAAPSLPPHEVASDVLFLVELVGKVDNVRENTASVISETCHLIQDINYRVPLDISASSWSLIVESFGRIIDVLVHSGGKKGLGSCSAAGIKPMIDCLESLRRLIGAYHRKSSLPENTTLVKFLGHVIMSLHAELYGSSHFNCNQKHAIVFEKKTPRYSSLWEVQTLALVILGESFSRIGSSFPLDIWQFVIEVLRREMDVLASKNILIENNIMSKFYASLLQCLHLVLADRKCSLSDHVPGFVAALRIFLTYSLTSRKARTIGPVFGLRDKEVTSTSSKPNIDEAEKVDRKPYRPPHLRKKDSSEFQRNKNFDSKNSSDYESSVVDMPSSDSDYSDSDSSMRDIDSRNSKVRLAAVICIQDLCQADPKAFSTQWTMLLPSFDVLEERKFDSSLMTCVLADPHVKVRIAAASTLAVMLDGPSTVFLQVAEYKDASKYGSFTSLSTSLGQILMQLHKGIMYLIMRETHSGLLASLFNVLMHLISSTPYARMPEDLLPTVITTLRTKIEEGFLPTKDQTGLLVAAISCLTAALSTSNSLSRVEGMLMEEISKGFKKTAKNTGILCMLFQQSEPSASLAISFEALQALRAVSHHYPNIMLGCWEQVFSTVFNCLEFTSPEGLTSPHGGHSGNSVIGEKVITAAIKVLDACLRAVSGFRGTEDLLDDKLLDTPFISDYVRAKKISSAPSDGSKSLEDFKDDPQANHSGVEPWDEAIEKYLPLTLGHTSTTVRSASITCFAGITSSVFFSLPQLKQDFIISSIINAAVQDVPSVRLAACRAIGVVTCFPKICRSAEILEKFIRSVEINTSDSLVSVRVTASWALANICDSLKHCFDNVHPRNYLESDIHSGLLALLIDCALHLTNDGDKVKSNAVRALGNLSRLVPCTSGIKEHTGSSWRSCTDAGSHTMQSNQRLLNPCHSCSFQGLKLLEKIVQAFLSSVTTGNVKVQWNVCHALSNLFRNETLKLEDQDWAPSVFSILLLLLRDSSNYKIRIQAAAALAVPASAFDYGRSFSDVVQGLEHVLENLGSDQMLAPSSFKYRVALEKQLTSTMLHVLTLVSSVENQSLGEFLVKKSLFFEEWLKLLCKSLMETSSQIDDENFCTEKQKKQIISKAIWSLIEVYQSRKHLPNVGKFEILYETIG